MNAPQVKLIYKTEVNPQDLPQVTCSSDAAKMFREVFDRDTIGHVESFYVMLLNRENRVLGISLVGIGGINGTVADVRVIMQNALLANASGIILCHNHPSGQMKPSEADKYMTKKIKEAGKIMEIEVLDHIIIAPFGGYYSFADEGNL